MRSRRLLLSVPLLILATACAEEKNDNESWLDPAASQTTTMPAPATTTDTHAGTTVLVTITDGRIAAPESAIPQGPAVLTVANAGNGIHNLHVEGPGVQAALDAPLDAGGNGTINVTFQQGTYTLYCPVLDHRNQGETLTLPIPTQQ
jgi:hypothetical protein